MPNNNEMTQKKFEESRDKKEESSSFAKEDKSC